MEHYLKNKQDQPCVAAITDLKKSGLELEIIKEAGLSVFRGRMDDLKKELGFAQINGLSILQNTNLLCFPYYAIDGRKTMTRFKPVPQIDETKKYLHPLKTPAVPYILPRVWAVKDKPNKPIWITEGEKKCLKLLQHGRNAIALPGVWAFKAGKNSDLSEQSKYLWGSLKSFAWHGRTVYLAFDMDLWTNPQVRCALYEMAVKLMAEGAIVKFPRWDEGKGIDDYLVSQPDPDRALSTLEESAKAIGEFAESGHHAELMRALAVADLRPVVSESIVKEIAKSLKVKQGTIKEEIKTHKCRKDGGVGKFFERFYQVETMSSVIDAQTGKTMSINAFRLQYPTLGKIWIESDNKRVIPKEKIVFKPNGCADDEINLFKGLEIKQSEGSCDLIVRLIKHLTLDDPDLFRWVICWLAFPLQNIGAKMRTTLVFHGGQGSGKNLIFQDLMCGIYGQYSSYLTQARLEDNYTDWMSGKLFVVCDEVLARKEFSRHANILKTYITQPIAPVRRMYEPAREEENHANFVFLSNETMPVLIDPDDRRYVIIRQENKLEKDFYKEVAKQIYGGGQWAFAKYLLEFDVGDFNEHTEPIMTEAKEDLISLCEPSALRFLKLWSAGELEFPFCTCTSEALYSAFLLWCIYNKEYNSASFSRFSAEIGRIICSQKIAGIIKGAPRVTVGSKTTQRKGWIVDLSEEVVEQWFAGKIFAPNEVDQTGRFNIAVEDFKKKVEDSRLKI